MRILDGARIQAEYHARKRKVKEMQEKRQRGEVVTDEGDTAGPSSSSSKAGASMGLKIRPGEKLGDYNRRVEQAMASQVAATARSEARKRKKQKRAERAAAAAADSDEEDEDLARRAKGKDEADRRARAEPSSEDLKRIRQDMVNGGGERAIDFAKASQVRRINDVAQAPPTFSKLPRGQGPEALRRKEALAAALKGEDAPAVKAISTKRVTKGQMPEPVKPKDKKKKEKSSASKTAAAVATGGLRRQKELEDERVRAIKLYRQRKSLQQQS